MDVIKVMYVLTLMGLAFINGVMPLRNSENECFKPVMHVKIVEKTESLMRRGFSEQDARTIVMGDLREEAVFTREFCADPVLKKPVDYGCMEKYVAEKIRYEKETLAQGGMGLQQINDRVDRIKEWIILKARKYCAGKSEKTKVGY